MPKLHDVCDHVRSKNAGPFWITIDIFFRDTATMTRHTDAAALSSAAIGARFGVAPELVKRFAVASLAVLKISYPRAKPQGGEDERDMHGGQQYVGLLDVDV